MKVVKRSITMLLAMLMVAALVLGFGTTKAKAGEVLKAAMQGEPQQIRTYDGGTYGGLIGDMMYDGLIFFNSQTNEYEPCLATSWETIDDCTIRYHLRDDVFTKNGTQIVASDVIYSFRLGAENSNISQADFSYYDIDNFEVIDDFTIDIKTFEPFANAFIYLAQTSFYIHSEADLEPLGGWDALMTDAPDAYGRYLFKEWVPGDHITVVKNENYWGEKGYFDEIEVSFIADDTARYFAIQAGDVDVITYATDSQAKEAAATSGLQVFQQKSGAMTAIAFNCAEGQIFENEALRKAVCYAINKEAVVQVYSGGFGSAVDVLLPTGNPLYVPVDNGYTYDPDKAKELLAEAGYPDGFSFTVVLAMPYQKIAEVVQSNLAEIGIEMKLDTRELTGWLEASNSGDYEANMVSFFPGNNIQPFYMMDARVPYANKGVTQVKSDEWYDLLDQLYATPDVEAGKEFSKPLIEIFGEHLPAACIVSKDYLFIANDNLTDFYCITKCDMLHFDMLKIAE